ncbi:core protein A15 [BeAn 58058 virus]|uniref:core protein A15 n=1 Tax=BeAn 58058 virus TaxID=67082 RepID=UPI00090A2D00|nr:core protein A15 [BeAn 58058 virus]APG58324.1 core protein A15 [BeAn 58058 virus]
MLVGDDTLILYNNWPICILKSNKIIPFPCYNSFKFSEFVNVNKQYKDILLINPTNIQLLSVCVYLKRNKWNGNIYILFEGDSTPPPFRIVNDN